MDIDKIAKPGQLALPAPRPATPIAGTWDSLPPKVDEAQTATAPWKNRFNQQQNGTAAQHCPQHWVISLKTVSFGQPILPPIG